MSNAILPIIIPRLAAVIIYVMNNSVVTVVFKADVTQYNTAVQQVEDSFSSIEKSADKTSKGTSSKLGGLKSAFGDIAKSLAASGIQKMFSAVSSSMDSAISRTDTINNFANVLEAGLGVSAEESQAAINKLSDGLDGLPTSLDSAASSVQAFSSVNKNVNQSTDYVLALNDALLAGGKSTEIQSNALEQLSQMYATGSVDAQGWKSALEAMPLQLGQVAESMGYTSAVVGGDLYNALQSGEVSMDDFMQKIVELDQTGSGELGSFHDQAVAATGGIGTQMDNLQNTVNKVLQGLFNGDMSAVDSGLNQLVERVNAIIPQFLSVMTSGVSLITSKLPEMLPPIIEALSSALPTFIQAVVTLVNGIVAQLPTILALLINAVTANLPALVEGLVSVVITIADTLTNPDNLTMLMQAGVSLFLALVDAIPQIIISLVDALPQVIDNVISFLTDPSTIGMLISAAVTLFTALVTAVPRILGSIVGAFGTLVGNVWNGISSTFTSFASGIADTISGIFKSAINSVIGFLESVLNTPMNLINGFIDGINSVVGVLGISIGKLPTISLPRLATGGVVTSPTLSVVGESGAEAVMPLERNTGWIDELADRIAARGGVSGSGQIVNNYEVYNDADVALISRDQARLMRRMA